MLHEALDRATLAGGIATLEKHRHLLPTFLDPVLGLEEFGLKRSHLLDIGALREAVGIRVGAGFKGAANGIRLILERPRQLATTGPTALGRLGLGRLG